MKVKLETEKQINKFYKLLFLYKSPLFIFTKFESKTNDKELNLVINGLNIKNRRKRINYIYEETISFINEFYKDKNICNFKNNQCGLHRNKELNYKCGCCRRCLYVSDKGCTTENITCKMFCCSYIKERYKTLDYSNLKLLKLLSIKNQLLIRNEYFSKKENILNDLYCFTFTISSIRLIIRTIINYIIKKERDNLYG